MNPIRLKDMALSNTEWVTIFDNTVHDGTIEADTLYRPEDLIYEDSFHTKKTMTRILNNRAVDLTLRLLREGRKITFKDGEKSERVIAAVSPPLYVRHYKNSIA
jgi:hypothetical protein